MHKHQVQRPKTCRRVMSVMSLCEGVLARVRESGTGKGAKMKMFGIDVGVASLVQVCHRDLDPVNLLFLTLGVVERGSHQITFMENLFVG